MAGIRYCYATQRNLKIHAAAAVAAVSAGVYLGLSAAELAVLALTIAGVIAAEMLNTAVEAVVDLVSPEFHPLAKIAKDVAAGAVLVMAFASLAVAYLLFVRKITG
jgi:diacylglycerol kinase